MIEKKAKGTLAAIYVRIQRKEHRKTNEQQKQWRESNEERKREMDQKHREMRNTREETRART